MCFAGIETDVKTLMQQVATKAEVKALDARIDLGHLYVLVEDRGWVRSADLLEGHAGNEQELPTRPAFPHPPLGVWSHVVRIPPQALSGSIRR